MPKAILQTLCGFSCWIYFTAHLIGARARRHTENIYTPHPTPLSISLGEGPLLELADSSVDNSTTVALREICCVVICLILSSCSRTICLVSGQDTRPYNRRAERGPVFGADQSIPPAALSTVQRVVTAATIVVPACLPAWHGHKNQKSIKIHLIILQRVLFCSVCCLPSPLPLGVFALSAHFNVAKCQPRRGSTSSSSRRRT